MTDIHITEEDFEGMARQIKEALGGSFRERWGASVLEVSGALANGSIRLISFDWGVRLLEFKLRFYQDTHLCLDIAGQKPLHFVYCLEGTCRHTFEDGFEEAGKTMERYQSVILANRSSGRSHWYFPKDQPLAICIIQVIRKKFLKKQLKGMEQLNNRLYEVFHDLDHEKRFSFYGAYDLKMAKSAEALMGIEAKNLMASMKIEGLLYQLLARHITDHDTYVSSEQTPKNLLKRELEAVRKLADAIAGNPAKNYRLDALSEETGLSQAKLQEGFRHFFNRTVTQYIRHVRLESARDYLRESDMNISQVVYSVGFSSRSYFSKIFRAKYGMSPSTFKKRAVKPARKA